jgi:hypothetical protein
MRLAATFLLAAITTIAAHAATPPAAHTDPRLGDAYAFKHNGWTYVHLDGSPSQIGFQHGFLLARQIEDNVHVYQVEDPHKYHKSWAFFRDAGRTILWPHIDPEYQAELKGIAAGLKAAHSRLDLWDIVALNGNIELTEYWLPWYDKQHHEPVPAAAVAPGKCSAFIATGSATKDGKIVIAHSNWSAYAEGERWNYVFDITPTHGYHMLMDGLPGVITSQDDFGVNAAGIMITETTLPMAVGFNPNAIPEFSRSRKAMQYADSIATYAAIMRKGNNGGYANSWLIGDRKTNQIAYLELGLHETPLTVKKDGYFVSSNFAANPELIKVDTPGFNPNNLQASMNARHVRAEQFMHEHYGKLDTALAEAYLSDHYDTWEHKIDPDRRTLCGHEDESPTGDPVWGSKPYQPGGAVTGKVMDSDMAAKLSFIARSGHPCGENFYVAPFLAAHPQFDWEKPILHDMIAGPWTTFEAGETAMSATAIAER